MPCLRILNGSRERDGDAERLRRYLRIEMACVDMLVRVLVDLEYCGV